MQKTELSVFFMQVQASIANQKLPQTQMKQILAQALVEKLQNWCMQLFWMTVFCVISCCGEENDKKATKQTPTEPKKRIEDIEQKMLRHLTSPMISGTLRPIRKTTKRRVLSRPPSPQLFDIDEEE